LLLVVIVALLLLLLCSGFNPKQSKLLIVLAEKKRRRRTEEATDWALFGNLLFMIQRLLLSRISCFVAMMLLPSSAFRRSIISETGLYFRTFASINNHNNRPRSKKRDHDSSGSLLNQARL
jgi:hypothetical protein